MKDSECVDFLRWALPRLGMNWLGFRRVRRQVCRRLGKRLGELRLENLATYRSHLGQHAAEWPVLRAVCRVTISRFCRDRKVFEYLCQSLLPALAERAERRRFGLVRCWSAGCASGEEPYSLALAWCFGPAANMGARIRVLGTDIDRTLLERAASACYDPASLRELPPEWLSEAFTSEDGCRRLKPVLCRMVRFRQGDVVTDRVPGLFDFILCRNLVFTYFDAATAIRILERFRRSLYPGGYLLLGGHEHLPEHAQGWTSVPICRGLYQLTEP